jgi:hypothetical protein
LSVSTGSWSGSPTGYEYRWFRCDPSGHKCVTISGATSAAYTLTKDDVGSAIRAGVIATNAAGSTHEKSRKTATVDAA